MNEMIRKLLADHGPELIQSLVSKAGFSAEEADGFLPIAVEKVVAALQDGGLDVGALLGGSGVGSLLAKVDSAGIAAEAGVDPAKASAGLGELVPTLLSSLSDSSGGAEGLLSALGGGDAGGLLGAAGGLAGKLFK